MMVWLAFHYSSYGTFCVHLKSSIISTVVLPTTEIIEPFYLDRFDNCKAIFSELQKYSENSLTLLSKVVTYVVRNFID